MKARNSLFLSSVYSRHINSSMEVNWLPWIHQILHLMSFILVSLVFGSTTVIEYTHKIFGWLIDTVIDRCMRHPPNLTGWEIHAVPGNVGELCAWVVCSVVCSSPQNGEQWGEDPPQTTAPDHSPWPQPQTTAPDHSPRPQPQTTQWLSMTRNTLQDGRRGRSSTVKWMSKHLGGQPVWCHHPNSCQNILLWAETAYGFVSLCLGEVNCSSELNCFVR